MLNVIKSLWSWITRPVRSYYQIPYVVAGAIRGPDTGGWVGDVLKGRVTARVRAIVYPKEECNGFWIKAPLHAGDLTKINEARLGASDSWYALAHYRHHLLDALKATWGHPVWGGQEAALKAALQPD